MNYKNIDDPSPRAKTQMLRRMWLVKVYDGDKEDPNCPIREETVIAWNAVHATQLCGEIAELPEALGFVTWPHEGKDKNDIYFIDSPLEGPTDRRATPSISIPDTDDWSF